ncbi:hypothetical protein BYT27DRAFT_7147471 [Phlegmacium glaucopus]|nr:hypothetical protein BYT27DRAFT_7147471 [Phlegmacium glaucopus]
MDYLGMARDLQNGMPAQEPKRMATFGTAASSFVDPMVNNPTVQSALQVLGALSDAGKALPFVAPAFILLKVIIDIEQRAQDADAKCTDLIERITFMLSHLPALEKVEIVPATRQVIDRMNEALKEAAALVASYRKQSRVVRRLRISNRDKFAASVVSINTCCSDLLMSLQIHQTGKLDILTRGIPVDAEDLAADTFIASHGSIDAVVHDRELVKEFAKQQHLVMDDSVMEQLNSNIADSMSQNHLRLEGILKDNVNSAIVNGLKGLAAEMYASEAEQRFKCIQCDKEFTNYNNGPKACSFHRGEFSSWTKSYPCCGTAHPCQFDAHRAKHHCDYPYASFFPRAYAITGYVDTVDSWTAVEDTNLETDEVQKASIGLLLRWVSRGARIDENTLLISVGRIWYNTPYYFNTFTAKELEDITKSVRLSRRTMIYRTSPNENEYAMAEWILSISGKITGVRLTAKSATSINPYVRVCPIDLSTCSKSGDILTISEGGMRSYTPASPYILPETVRVGPEVSDSPTRPVRTNFKTRTSTSLRIILRTTSDPPLIANPKLADTTSDYFEGTVSAFNNHAPGSLNPITIAAVSASFRLVGEPEYRPAESCKLLEDCQVPVTLEPRQSCIFKFQVTVPRTEDDSKVNIRWWNRAFVARYRPVRIKLILEDIEGEECSLVLEYVYKPFSFEKQKDSDLGFFFFDNPVTVERYHVSIEPPSEDKGVVKIRGTNIDVNKLEKAVHKALKTGETEVDLGIGQDKYGEWEWNVWALIDLSCRRVYAFKLLMKEGKNVPVKRFACLGYVLCPDYGDIINKTRPISYATETVTLPSLEPYPIQETVLDDTLDDFKPPVPPKPTSPISDVPPGSGSTSFIPVELNSRLASIDSSLARIAAALEQLVAVMPKSSTA